MALETEDMLDREMAASINISVTNMPKPRLSFVAIFKFLNEFMAFFLQWGPVNDASITSMEILVRSDNGFDINDK